MLVSGAPGIQPFLPGLALAVAIGLVIGFERGWQLRDEPPGRRVAGVRTNAMLGLLGGLIGLAGSGSLQPLALLVAIGAIAALLVGHGIAMRGDHQVSATAAIASMTTMLLGALASTGHAALASVSAGVLVGVLAAREPLHRIVRESSASELEALIRLALVIFVILPLLPDIGLGPYGSLNPRRLWFVVVVVGLISFGGYVLVRWLGRERGSLLTALLGALVSSTAVTVACAHELRQNPGIANQAAISLASTIMLSRTVILVAILAPLALHDVLWLVGPALAGSIVAGTALAWATRGSTGLSGAAAVRPPGLGIAFLFAFLVALLSLVATWVEHELGSGSGAAVIAVGGMVDVDSAIAAIGALPADALSPRLAAIAIATPVAFNSLLKLVLALAIAGPRRCPWASANLGLTAAVVLGSVAAVLL